MQTSAREAQKVKILIVDDLPENLLALQAVLRDCGYEVIEAGSGQEAIVQAALHDFAAVILDVQMPKMDGFEAARRLRKLPRSASTPIVFVTAIHRSDGYEQLGYIAGAVDFLFKPLNPEILRSKVSVFAELYRKNQENIRQAELLKEAELKEQENRNLRQAIQARDEFLAVVSHELKTPMTPLNLQLQTFIRLFREGRIDQVPAETLLRLLDTAHNQVERMSRLINDLVEMSRLKSGKLDLRRERVDLVRLVNGVVDAYRTFPEEAPRPKIQISAGGEVSGHWDPLRIEQVVVNLVSNAVKYGAGKPIEVSVAAEGGKALISVRDQGIGVPPEDQERIFQRFERAVSSRNFGGLGLGLFIADRLTRLHEGKISLESQPGQGAKFTVELPLAACPA